MARFVSHFFTFFSSCYTQQLYAIYFAKLSFRVVEKTFSFFLVYVSTPPTGPQRASPWLAYVWAFLPWTSHCIEPYAILHWLQFNSRPKHSRLPQAGRVWPGVGLPMFPRLKRIRNGEILDSYILKKVTTQEIGWKNWTSQLQSGSSLYPTWLVKARFVKSLMRMEVEYWAIPAMAIVLAQQKNTRRIVFCAWWFKHDFFICAIFSACAFYRQCQTCFCTQFMDNKENNLNIRDGFWKTFGKTANFTRPCLASLVNVRASPSLPATPAHLKTSVT